MEVKAHVRSITFTLQTTGCYDEDVVPQQPAFSTESFCHESREASPQHAPHAENGHCYCPDHGDMTLIHDMSCSVGLCRSDPVLY